MPNLHKLLIVAIGLAVYIGVISLLVRLCGLAAIREKRAEARERCECGCALAHVGGDGVNALLCPTCDADALFELSEGS
jgi:hypothetical protein